LEAGLRAIPTLFKEMREAAMKRLLAPAAVLISAFFLLGMGELGGGPAPIDKIPTPEKNFAAAVVDREGVQTTLQFFSLEGKIFLAGKHGSASIAVPFEKIAEIQFSGPEGSEIQVRVLLRDQKSVPVKIDKRSKFFGKTDFGTYQIEAKDLKTIRLLF
jgi:hypothetical protein